MILRISVFGNLLVATFRDYLSVIKIFFFWEIIINLIRLILLGFWVRRLDLIKRVLKIIRYFVLVVDKVIVKFYIHMTTVRIHKN